MTTTEQELSRIQGAKSALRDAIRAKGGTLSEEARIDEYAPALERISNQHELTPIRISYVRTSSGKGSFWGFAEMIESPPIDVSTLTDAYCLYYDCRKLETVQPIELPLCTTTEYMFGNCSSLRTIDLDIPKCTNTSNIFTGCAKLANIRIKRLQCSLSLVGTAVTAESVQYIVEHAQEAMDGAVLTLPRALESKLPEETMEMALEKGFDVGFR